MTRSLLKICLVALLLVIVGFYFVGDAQAVVPADCTDYDGNSCISSSECADPVNDPNLGGTCSVCPAGNCGGLPTVSTVGENCDTDADCDTGLFCLGGPGGSCAECSNNSQCGSGETCDNLVCVESGGNDDGDWCLRDSQCASGQCDIDGTCAEASGSTGPGGSAPGGESEDNWLGIDLSIQDVADIIEGIACWLLRVSFLLAIIFIILAGIRFMAAQGNPASFTKAKTNFFHVLIGVIVIVGIYEIIATVANAVGRTDFSLIPLVC